MRGVFRVFLSILCLCALATKISAEGEGENADSAESVESRDRRGSSYHHRRGFGSTPANVVSHFQIPGKAKSYSVSPPGSPSPSRLNNGLAVFAAKPRKTQHRPHSNRINKRPTSVFPGQLTHFQSSSFIPDGPFQFPVKGGHPPISVSHSTGPPFKPFVTGFSTPNRHPFSPAPTPGFTPARDHGIPVISVGGPTPGCSKYDDCVPIIACAPFYPHLLESPNSQCQMYNGAKGVCCPFRARRGFSQRFFPGPDQNVPIKPIAQNVINEAAREAIYELQRLDKFEIVLQERNVVVSDPRRPAFGHLQFFKTSPQAMAIGRDALTIVFTSNALTRRLNLGAREAGFGLASLNVQNSIIDETCPRPPNCGKKENYYRTIDGSCNNFRNSHWGRARSPFARLLPPQYENGIESPRVRSRVGVNLPSARVVSISNVVDQDRPNPGLSLSVMQWGQFIDHDLTHTPIRRFGNMSGIECCNEKGQPVQKDFNHPACMPIEIPRDDPFYSRFGRRCMNFVRSQIAPKVNCSLGYEEQMNQITHFLDGSAVYGSSAEEEREIRAFQGGKLKTQRENLLPPDRSASQEECDLTRTRNIHCFLAGDNRVNEQPDLAAIHTIWVRQHNRLAMELSKINPYWSDETIYQETRRIVAAQIQHIVYNEFLPVILGADYAQHAGLLPLRDGYSDAYDEGVDPTILNEFATVAFRFGHTLVQGMIQLFDKNHRPSESLTLHEHFNSPHLLYQPGKLDEFLRGLVKQPMQSFDNFVTMELQHRLFQTEMQPFGMDLIALNIQRGRDHGVATYNDLREACGLPRARRFEDFIDVLSPETIATFKLLYPTVDDVDPFIAGISEAPVPDGAVGPLFRCIIGEQFKRLRRGDRFFYDNGGQKSSFTEAQLAEIRKTSWARILCDNGMHIKHVQPLAFRLPGPLNEKTDCSSPEIPHLDLTFWTSEKSYH